MRMRLIIGLYKVEFCINEKKERIEKQNMVDVEPGWRGVKPASSP